MTLLAWLVVVLSVGTGFGLAHLHLRWPVAAAEVTAAPDTDLQHYRWFLEDCVWEACKEAGLDTSRLGADFDIAATGKLNDVLVFTARRLQGTHPMRTMGDVVRLLEGAP